MVEVVVIVIIIIIRCSSIPTLLIGSVFYEGLKMTQ